MAYECHEDKKDIEMRNMKYENQKDIEMVCRFIWIHFRSSLTV